MNTIQIFKKIAINYLYWNNNHQLVLNHHNLQKIMKIKIIHLISTILTKLVIIEKNKFNMILPKEFRLNLLKLYHLINTIKIRKNKKGRIKVNLYFN